MNRRLSTSLLFWAIFSLPLAGGAQQTDSIARRVVVDGPSFHTENIMETSKGASPSISVHELSIPEHAVKSYRRGIDRLFKNDPAGSLIHLRRAASEFPEYYEAYHAIGLAQLRLGHEKDAQEAFQKSIDASGGYYAEPHFGLSAVLCNRQKFADAVPIIRKALELAPAFGPGHFILAWALFGLNRLDEAEQIAHEASILSPKFAPTHLLLANIYNRRTDYSAVLSELDAYLRLEPDGPMSDQVRLVQGLVKQKLIKSAFFVEAVATRP
jgi:tetratricopeptide (TPR) repeat protein